MLGAVVIGLPSGSVAQVFSAEATLGHDATELRADVVFGDKGADGVLAIEEADGELKDVEEFVLVKLFDEVEVISGDAKVADFSFVAGFFQNGAGLGEVGGIWRAVVKVNVEVVGLEAAE